MTCGKGFYTALGTPLDAGGDFIAPSFRRQVEDQLAADAAGFLALGSMGNQPGVKNRDVPAIARACCDSVQGRCPVLVGVMDNSIARVMERIDSLTGVGIDGVVATTPFFYPLTQPDVVGFFEIIAKRSPFPVFLYDLPAVTGTVLARGTIESLIRKAAIRGIKTGTLATARTLLNSQAHDGTFDVIFSGLDVFDVAYHWGLHRNLDGMFTMTARAAQAMYRQLDLGDTAAARESLDTIVGLRDLLARVGGSAGFSTAMNLLGYSGSFAHDYCAPLSTQQQAQVRNYMQRCNLL
jgi:4-hydroxy-tetrahydrodipicolinate synthase